jgi:DNA topoisomerase VI subunit A
MTGCGMHDLTTREFLNLLKNIIGLPIYGLCDTTI